ncbi:MAG: hypothetical protein ACRD8A_16815 [Candidatus Acidiferrales bacterium]
MVSSKTSEPPAPRVSVQPQPRLDPGRFRGHRGGLIATHRALARFVLNPFDLLISAALVAFLSVLWLLLLPFVCRFWRIVFTRGARILALNTAVGITDRRFSAYFHLSIPFPRVESVAPTSELWWASTLAVLLLFGLSFLLKNNKIPFAYLIRAALCVQVSALAYFAWSPAAFPHTSSGYLEGLVGYGIVLISLIPALFGFTYFIFDFGLFRKVLLTFVTMIHLCLFVPLQALLHAVILQKSILFMPVLYIIFGLPLDILVVIAFYSWGMSWSS